MWRFPKSIPTEVAADYLFVDTTRRDALVEKHLHLVPPLARSVHRRVPPSFELDDLIAEGSIGLLRAAERFRPAEHGNTPFGAFARPRIRGAIIDSVRRRGWLENTHGPLEDAPEQATEPQLSIAVRGKHLQMPRRLSTGPRVAFKPDALPPRLYRAWRELTARQRTILGAFYSDAGTLAEIAAGLCIPPAAAIAEHAAALESLRSVLVQNLSNSGLDRIYFREAA